MINELAGIHHMPFVNLGGPAEVVICVGRVDVNMYCAGHKPHTVFYINGDSVHLYSLIGRTDRIILS